MASKISAVQLEGRFELPQLNSNWDLPYKYMPVVMLLSILCWQAIPLISNSKASFISSFPIVDQGPWWDVFNLKAKIIFYLDGRRALDQASRQAGGRPFRMLGPGVLVTILPPEYADEIRNDKRLDFSKVVAKVSCHVIYFVVLWSGLNTIFSSTALFHC